MPPVNPTQPNPAYLDDKVTPTITLAGKAWPIPMLAVKQNRIVSPNLLQLLPRFANINAATLADPSKVGAIIARLDILSYDLLLDAVYAALTRAHPLMKRVEFDDMEIPTIELMQSMEVLARQTGLFVPGHEKPATLNGEIPRMGEVAARVDSPTGTESSVA